MAFSPCAVHGGRYAGGANTFFLRLVDGMDSRGGKVQTCAKCAESVSDYLDMKFILVSRGDEFFEFTEPLACANCGGELGEHPSKLYANSFCRGQKARQHYGLVCEACDDAVAEDLALARAASS